MDKKIVARGAAQGVSGGITDEARQDSIIALVRELRDYVAWSMGCVYLPSCAENTDKLFADILAKLGAEE